MIVCIGWGSLIWRPENLPICSEWWQDGPSLPLEFARMSTNGSVTLVIVGKHINTTLWAELNVKNVDEAVESLRRREGNTPRRNIGFVNDENVSNHTCGKEIAAWAKNKKINAVVWTALAPKFQGEDGKIPSKEELISYLSSLDEGTRALAEQYVTLAPAQIRTPYRTLIEEKLGWRISELKNFMEK